MREEKNEEKWKETEMRKTKGMKKDGMNKKRRKMKRERRKMKRENRKEKRKKENMKREWEREPENINEREEKKRKLL